MNYFPIKSFISWGCAHSSTKCRVGTFTIELINNQYNNELYFTYVSEYIGKCYSYYSSAYNNTSRFNIRSPEFETEERAVRWLEEQLKSLVKEKIEQYKRSLENQVKSCDDYLNKILSD